MNSQNNNWLDFNHGFKSIGSATVLGKSDNTHLLMQLSPGVILPSCIEEYNGNVYVCLPEGDMDNSIDNIAIGCKGRVYSLLWKEGWKHLIIMT